ncbi:MAG: S49 family peptidase, partial [Prevotellaceae bacterium]|nr:S49 family peptidase [Prevotellaceae bacterium]
MKQFLKFTLAAIVGITIVVVLGFFVLFGVVGSIVASSDLPTVLKPNSVYLLELNGNLIDRSKDDSFERALGEIYGFSTTTLGLDDILSNIEKAKADPNIVGIYLKGGSLAGGYASIKEIRDALLDFKESGKFVIAYADAYTQRNYYLASVADKILLNPIGMVEWQGISSQVAFYKNTLDKLGVEMQIVRVGTFKSAVEPYTNTKMSNDNRRQVTAYTQSFWNEIVNAVSFSRGISGEKLNQYADEALLYQPTEKSLEYALVDSLVYADQAEKFIEFYADSANKAVFVKHPVMTKAPANVKYEKDKVAVIYAVGGIDTDAREGIISEDLVEEIQKVAGDESVKSVVFRISSP